MTATFTQTTTSKGFGVTGAFAGSVSLEKPGKMRWNYDEPKGRTMVADGETLYLYEPEEKVVYREPLSGYFGPDAPALFLAGETPLTDLFFVDLIPAKQGDTVTKLRLTPKIPQPSVKAILLEIDSKTELPAAVSVADFVGNVNRIAFAKVTPNKPIPPDTFTFTLPAGTKTRSMSLHNKAQ
jgi:outer membrane lipoprotein carrier protein